MSSRILHAVLAPAGLKFRLGIAVVFLALAACEPLATSFPDREPAENYVASSLKPAPDTVTSLRIMTWNIRFGAARLPWFGDACGDRVILTEEEVYSALQLIVDRINAINPDILLLQEVDMNSKRSCYIDELRWILDRTGFNYATYGSQWRAQFIPSDGLGRMEEGNAIFSRWKISDAERIQLQIRGDQDKLTRYFYERCCMVTARIELPGVDNFYAVNIHASAFATDDTKQKHIQQFKQELDRIDGLGGWFVAGGDLNTLPPGSDTTDYCIQDMCSWESFHAEGDDPLHKEGSDYTPEKHWLDTLYVAYLPAVTKEDYLTDPYHQFTHTTRGTHFWDRTLDYLFSNRPWTKGSAVTHQEATRESDHAPVSGVQHISR